MALPIKKRNQLAYDQLQLMFKLYLNPVPEFDQFERVLYFKDHLTNLQKILIDQKIKNSLSNGVILKREKIKKLISLISDREAQNNFSYEYLVFFYRCKTYTFDFLGVLINFALKEKSYSKKDQEQVVMFLKNHSFDDYREFIRGLFNDIHERNMIRLLDSYDLFMNKRSDSPSV